MKNILIHMGVWFCLIVLRLAANNYDSLFENLLVSVLMYTNFALIFYAAAYLQKMASKLKNYLLLVLGIAFLLVAGTLLIRVEMSMLRLVWDIDLPPGVTQYVIFKVLFWLVLGVLYQVVLSKRQAEDKQREILLEKKETEVQLLKTQMNPHFFFNTLNNIYGLTFKKDDKAPQVVLMLSEAMRYILYETQSEFVPLANEIGFLKNYIELERLRVIHPDNIHFTSASQTLSHKVAPLILLPFIENCFKHSNINDSAKADISINIWEEGNQLFFSAQNTYAEQQVKMAGGIGMKNVIQRLKLIYNDDYELESKKEEGTYYVFLKLPLYKA